MGWFDTYSSVKMYTTVLNGIGGKRCVCAFVSVSVFVHVCVSECVCECVGESVWEGLCVCECV